ncbi:MAG: glycosyltransferase, partial [Candidatus Peribacteraceae bacterium]|nr:glycosyltransferase [Candidatus Peribacteraceae bacterium]
GLSLIEALACGHPAFAFGVGAVPEVLGAVDPALVVSSRDTDRLIHLVEAYLSLSPAERDRRGARYRQKVLNSFSLSASAEALQALYRELAQ